VRERKKIFHSSIYFFSFKKQRYSEEMNKKTPSESYFPDARCVTPAPLIVHDIAGELFIVTRITKKTVDKSHLRAV